MDWLMWDLVLMALILGGAIVALLWILMGAAAIGRARHGGPLVSPPLQRDPTVGRDQYQAEQRANLERRQFDRIEPPRPWPRPASPEDDVQARGGGR